MISGWERSPFDLRPHGSGHRPVEAIRAVIPSEVAASCLSDGAHAIIVTKEKGDICFIPKNGDWRWLTRCPFCADIGQDAGHCGFGDE